jgi:choline dehydrogenase-like flavoprotein
VLVDGSALAIKVGVNPSLTITALAERATLF